MDLAGVLRALCDAEVDFLVIGGVSATFHGSAYITNDIDIFFSRKRENLHRLVQALAPFHPRLRDAPKNVPFVWDAATLSNGTVFTLGTDLGAVDLLAEVAGLGPFDDVKERSVAVSAFGRSIRTLDLKSLILSKRAVGRQKDLLALAELESLLEAQEPDQG